MAGEHPAGFVFAPDHKTIAYLWMTSAELPMVDSPRLAQKARIFWCSVDSPDAKRSAPVDLVAFKQTGSDLAGFITITFSPDSRRIAVLCRGRLSVLKLSDGRSERLTDSGEVVTSFAWQSADEITYIAYTNMISGHRNTADRTFWRQRIIAPMPARRIIRREERISEEPELSAGRREYWSPSGRYIIYMDQWPSGRFQCLDLLNVNVSPFGQADAYSEGVAWMPDESLAMCMSTRTGSDPRMEVLLFEPSTRRTQDVSPEFNKEFPRHPPQLEPTATPDNKFFIANALGGGGHLIRPRPWIVFPVGKELKKKVKAPDDNSHWISATSLPGWLQTGGWPGEQWALDYEGRRVVPLGDNQRGFNPGRDFVGVWVFDGSQIITVDYSNKVAVKRFELPGPATQSAPE